MTSQPTQDSTRMKLSKEERRARISRRERSEKRFKVMGLIAVLSVSIFLFILLGAIVKSGYRAFIKNEVQLTFTYDPALIDPTGAYAKTKDLSVLQKGDYEGILKTALKDYFPEVTKRKDRKSMYKLISLFAAGKKLREQVAKDPSLIGQTKTEWFLTHHEVEQHLSSPYGTVQDTRKNLLLTLDKNKEIRSGFAWHFLTNPMSSDPVQAGILNGLVGTGWLMLFAFLLAVPLGVLSAIYLEMFAKKSSLTDLIEININNLAAVPSVVFGLLGYLVFLVFFRKIGINLGRGAPVVGGLVLALMTLPTIIISTRAALKGVSPSYQQAALGMGASNFQAVFHHVLPAALPGVMTGAIIGMARALGETAPLLVIGMNAATTSLPVNPLTDPATAFPSMIYSWAAESERLFKTKAYGAIIVLLLFLILMNSIAIYIRQRAQKKQ